MTQSECNAYTETLAPMSDEQLLDEIVKQMGTMRENARKGISYRSLYDNAWDRLQCLKLHCEAQDKPELFTAGMDVANRERKGT